ncbi:MAG: hypothetical protein PVJ76_10005, partial [Gemmatimonadota bacterium]
MSTRRSSRFTAFLPFIGLLLGALIGLSSCGDGDPTGLDAEELDLLLVQGDGQASAPGTPLPVPLKVRVQRAGSGTPVEGAKVRWRMVVGAGAEVNPSSVETDSLGIAESLVTLGPEIGTYTVEALVQGTGSKRVEFRAEAILAPSLS